MKQQGILFYFLTWEKGQKTESIILKLKRNFSSYGVSGKGLVLKKKQSCSFTCQKVNLK